MATIIAFPARRTPGMTKEPPAGSRPADILFFTGVRIERHDDNARPRTRAAKRLASAQVPATERPTSRRRRN